jgi:hypothetical protein
MFIKTLTIIFNDLFEKFIFIKFIPNHTTCFLNILKNYDVNKLKTRNIERKFDTKT